MFKCKFCERETTNAGANAAHEKYCKSNPNKSIKINSPLAGKQKGKDYIIWNKGLTAETDDRLKPSAQAIENMIKARNDRSPPTEETKKKISESLKGNTNANHRGDRQSFYKDIRMDSSWEVGVAKYFDANEIDWTYGSKSFILSDNRHYYPDFFIIKDGKEVIVEVKGYFRENNKKKFEQFKKEFPDVEIELWDKDVLIALGITNKSGYVVI